MIKIQDVSFSYEGAESTPALESIDLQIADGELVVLAGVSGCGKTTLTRLLNGLIPDCFHGDFQGSVSVNGKNPQEEKAIGMSQIVGSVFQNPKSQFFNINSRNELAFPLENRGVSRKKILKRIEDTGGKLHMKPLIGRNMFHLSGGEKQKIAFASVSMADSDVLVLDEPSSNLDMEAVRDLRRVIEVWKAEGKTIVVSEHRFFFLKDLVDTLVLMEDGKIKTIWRGDKVKHLTPETMHQEGLRCFELSGCLKSPLKQDKEAGRLSIRHLHFSYPNSDRGIRIQDQSFEAGKVTAIIGHNGAGKSTFLRCLSGLQKHTDANVTLYGKAVPIHKMLDHTAMVMQDVNHQLFSDSVENELLFELKRRKIPRQQRTEEANRWLREIQLEGVKDQHPMSISGGQKQRLAIAAAALADKDIILFDEPTSGLDYVHMKQVADLIRKLAESGKFIFIVSHDLDLLLSTCDEVLLIENGCVENRYSLSEETQGELINWFQSL